MKEYESKRILEFCSQAGRERIILRLCGHIKQLVPEDNDIQRLATAISNVTIGDILDEHANYLVKQAFLDLVDVEFSQQKETSVAKLD